MIAFLSAISGLDPDLLRTLTALLGLITAACTATSTVHGVLNRRARKAAASDASATLLLVQQLVEALGVAKPAEIARIATEAATTATSEQLAPIHRFFAAVELIEHRREHRPETDLITILQEERAA